MRDGGDGRIYALITWKLTRCIDMIADYTSKICTPVIARAREGNMTTSATIWWTILQMAI